MGSSYKDLFKLYDLIQSGDVSSVEHFITNSTVQLNDILPCKGIGLLHLAVGIEPIEKSIECTEIILKNGGDPNLCNDDGVTPVHIAAIWGRVENLKLLIGCGGDPSRKDLDGLSAFDYAVREQQWNVFDYLHNVVDQINDSFGSPVAYSLDLERILLTTDQLVAEYEPGTDNQPLNGIATCRKSDMVRDWCEKSSLVMNKLYPTILGETFVVDDGPAAWHSINLTNNMTLDLTTDVNSNKSNLNETCNTFKTCLSKRTPVEISGIQRLQITSDESKVQTENSNDNLKQRFSVYENFSLPGSPNSIIHMNYNSKSSLRKNQSKDTSSSELKRLNFNSSQSLLTDDSQEFDKVLAVAQNKTNEWISNRSSDCQITDVRACNTRRSSASSGVSSNFSGGSIVIANVQEEYKYEDKEENVILIEKRLLVSSVVLPVEDAVDSPDQTAVSVASSLPSSVEYDNNTLRAELLRLGFRPGPIDNNNRTLYLKKLRTLQKNNSVKTTKQDKPTVKTTPQDKPTVKTTPQDKPTVKTTPQDKPTVKTKQQDKPTVKTTPQDKPTVKTTPQDKPVKTTLQNPIVRQIQGKTFSIELEKSLISDDWMRDLSPYMDLENKARADFCNPSQKWREGTSKTSFTYLLLDPRVTANLPARAGKQSNHVSWVTFVNSIFYVGKGKRSRPYSHLYQAQTLWKRDFTTSKDKKVQHILDIWTDKVGVVCLHIFQNVIPAEAYTYEAAMIDVIGVQNLKNLKCGNYYGAVQSWPLKDRRMLGLYLLYRAMLIFLSEGERQLRPQDIE